MKKEGFTLIELLAVIVILAIIALITVPVVTSIINSSKNKTIETSVKNYVRAVENNLLLREVEDNPIPNGTYEIMSNGNICIGGTVDNCTNIFEIEVEGDYPTQGTIILSNNKVISLIDVVFNSYLVNMNSNGEITLTNYSSTDAICRAVDRSQARSTALGTEYTCKVNDTTSYNFYVLSTEGSNVNLLMSKNLADNVPYGTEDNMREYSKYALLTFTMWDYQTTPYIFTQLDSLTSGWTNISNINKTYSTITGSVTLTGKARLATFDELAGPVCTSGPINNAESEYGANAPYYTDCADWAMGDYCTVTSTDYYMIYAMNSKYKTLDDYNALSGCDSSNCESFASFGIRPVITVSMSELS